MTNHSPTPPVVLFTSPAVLSWIGSNARACSCHQCGTRVFSEAGRVFQVSIFVLGVSLVSSFTLCRFCYGPIFDGIPF